MHNLYSGINFFSLNVCLTDTIPGIGADFFTQLLVKGYLMNKQGWAVLQTTMNSIIWPSGIGRLPTNVRQVDDIGSDDQPN